MRPVRRFSLVLIFLISIIVLIAVTCTKVSHKKAPIKIGINAWPGYAYSFIAEKKGFFKKNNVNVELVFDKEVTQTENRYLNGEIDGLFTVLADIYYINDQYLQTKVVYIADYSTTGDVIIAKPGISSVADLKGKTVSFEGVNSFSHIFVLNAIEKSGLMEAEVNFKNIPSQEVPEALEKGLINAGHTWNPAKLELIKKGYKIIATSADYDYLIIDVLAFRLTTIDNNPKAIRAIIKSLFEAASYLKSNRYESIKLMAEAEGMSLEAMADGLNGIVIPTLKENYQLIGGFDVKRSLSKNAEFIADFYYRHGQKDTILPLGNIIDKSFIYELSGMK